MKSGWRDRITLIVVGQNSAGRIVPVSLPAHQSGTCDVPAISS